MTLNEMNKLVKEALTSLTQVQHELSKVQTKRVNESRSTFGNSKYHNLNESNDNDMTLIDHIRGNINLSMGKSNLTELGWSPYRVSGNFSCCRNKLTNLEGCPKRRIHPFLELLFL